MNNVKYVICQPQVKEILELRMYVAMQYGLGQHSLKINFIVHAHESTTSFPKQI